MAGKGRPKTGGRVKGSKDKRTKLVEETAARLGVDPFEILMLFAAGDWEGLGYTSEVEIKESKGGESTFMAYTISPELRASSAEKAARYLYSHKQPVDPASGDAGIRIIIEDYSKKD